MNRKVWVTAAEAGDQVILVSLDRSLVSVGVMEVWGYKLIVDALLMHGMLQAGEEFIVHNMEERAEATVTEMGVEDLVGTAKFLYTALLQGLNQDGIAVMVKEDHELFAAEAEIHGEAPSFVP